MLDKEGNSIDAVIVTIPGPHARQRRRSTAWSVGSTSTRRSRWCAPSRKARMMVEAANKYKVATQMGNQGYSNEGTRQCAEMIWNGEIGNVTEVHAWTDRPIWPQGLTAIPGGFARTLDSRLGSLAGYCQPARLHFGRRRLSGSPLRR
jgi:hypothetical protein